MLAAVMLTHHQLHAMAQAACADEHACIQVNNELSPNPNPQTLYGALVEGSGYSDGYQDVRSLNNSRVQIDYNAGFQSALAGLTEAPGSWEQCLQVRGLLVLQPLTANRLFTLLTGTARCYQAPTD